MHRLVLLAALAALALPAAQAHVTLASPRATAGTYGRVVLQVPHGCAGQATVALTVHVPPQLLVAKPMPKPGWRLSVQQAPLAQPVQLHGRSVTESTSLVRWEGGPLPNAHYDEFVLFGLFADGPQAAVPFRVVQTCEVGEVDWAGAPGSATPAPLLQIEAAPADGAHHH
jgi:uncharacterized protein YcnI